MTAAFFYFGPELLRAAWPSLEKACSGNGLLIYVISSFGTHTVVFWGLNAGLYLLYSLNIGMIEQYKIQDKPWPWRRDAKTRQAYAEQVWLTLKTVTANQFLIALPSSYTVYKAAVYFGMQTSTESIPAWWRVAAEVLICLVVEDLMFYWGHRTLHHPRIYSYIHKQHHSFKENIGIASEYAHPVEFVVGNLIPFGTAGILMGSHPVVWIMWTCVRIGACVKRTDCDL
jgi:sterol desaturase/sphingolipid hydroxylase (fatty acid hydroxylase superfamily)